MLAKLLGFLQAVLSRRSKVSQDDLPLLASLQVSMLPTHQGKAHQHALPTIAPATLNLTLWQHYILPATSVLLPGHMLTSGHCIYKSAASSILLLPFAECAPASSCGCVFTTRLRNHLRSPESHPVPASSPAVHSAPLQAPGGVVTKAAYSSC